MHPLILALALLSGGSALAADPLPGPFDTSRADYDLIPNGGMESASLGNDLTRWEPVGGAGPRIRRDDELAFNGSFSAMLLDKAAVLEGVPVTQEADQPETGLTQGREYHLSGYIFNDLRGGGDAWIDLGDGIVVTEEETNTSGNCRAASTSGLAQWEFVSCRFRANSATPRVRMTIANSTGGTAAFDDVAITEDADFDPPVSLSFDYDGDGFTIEEGDCDEDNANAYPGADDTWYDGIDSNCDGADDFDQDGDGVRRAEDCDDLDKRTYPGAIETWYDGKDQNCDGSSDYDRDGDGYDSASYGGEDCNDSFSGIYPGAPEKWYDGVDQSCDGNDADQDLDGFDASEVGGPDCNDLDPDINPDADDTQGDGIDQDCNGVDLVSTPDRVPPPRRQVEGTGGGGRSGCTCSSAPASPSGGVLGLLLAGAVLRRRRE